MGEVSPASIPIGIEDIEPDHWIAWVFEIPGCYAFGPTRDLAIAGVSSAYERETKDDSSKAPVVVEEWRARRAPDRPDFIINAFFEDDRRPLSRDDINAAVVRLERQRPQLLALVQDVDLTARTEIEELLLHIAGAERWYLSCIGFEADRQREGESAVEMLARVRGVLLDVLPLLIGDARIGEDVGELWSVRKLVRRAIWHERDHLQQIQRMLTESQM